MKKEDIKVTVPKEVEKDAVAWVCEQLDLALQDRQQMEKRWEKWIKQYEEELPEKKTFPWPNCSNLSVPLSATAVETIHAREVNTLLSIRPYVKIKPKKKGVNPEVCNKLERFLDQVMDRVVNIYSVGSQWLLEKNKMGNGYVKVAWNYDQRKKGKTEKIEIDKVSVSVVNINDVIVPSNARNMESANWLAHRVYPKGSELERRKKQGIYDNVDEVLKIPRTSTVDNTSGSDLEGTEDRLEKIQKTAMSLLKEYEIFEVDLDYDVDNDGYVEHTIMTVHKDTRTLLRWIYFPYNHNQRTIIRNVYMERVNRFYAKGILEMSEHLSDGMNTVVNQVIDNATIANAKCFKGRKSARRELGQIYPGKTFWLDDPTDLQEFSLGEVHQSNFAIHNLLKDYHERRTKVNDYTTGRESSVLRSRATATGTMALLQESGRHFDLIINNSRNALVELAYQVIELYLQYKPEEIFMVDGEEIALPKIEGSLREEYDFYCAATSMSVNKEIEKQANLVMLQQLGGIFDKMLNLLMIANNPQIQLPDEIKKFVFSIIKSYYKMADDLIRSFEKIDIDQYLPELPDIVKKAYGQEGGAEQFMAQLSEMIGGMDGQGATSTGMAGLPQVSNMAGMAGTPK